MQTSGLQNFFRIMLGLIMLLAGIGHLSFQRTEFHAQVPDWIPLSKDFVVIASGVIEIFLGILMVFFRSQKSKVGIVLALFFVAVFPGNIAQYINHRDAFGLNTDNARLIRLFFQPVLVLWALWSSGVLNKKARQ